MTSQDKKNQSLAEEAAREWREEQRIYLPASGSMAWNNSNFIGTSPINHQLRSYLNLPETKKFQLELWSDFIASPIEEKWTIKKLLPATGLATVYGKPSAFKSIIVVDMAVKIALGEDWGDRGVLQGSVVYIASEGGIRYQEKNCWISLEA